MDTEMRTRLPALLLLALALPVAAAAATRAPSGSLSVEDGRGTVVVKGSGVIIGRVGSGSVQIADLTPNDRWVPIVNGVPRQKGAALRGVNISFRLLGGQYRVTVRGEGISVGARGKGTALLDGEPDALGSTGVYVVGDEGADCRALGAGCVPLPDASTRVRFGPEVTRERRETQLP